MNRERISSLLLLCAVILAIAMPIYRVQTSNHNLDVVYHYEMGRYLLEGQKPYIDFTDMNFPTIWYLSVIPSAVSNFIGSESTDLLLFIMMLTALSFYFVHRIIKKNSALSETERNLFLIVYLFVISNFQASNYGQREHLFFVLYIPYLLRRTYSDDEQGNGLLDAAIGFMAITGAMLKPYFVFAVIVIEFVLFLRKKNLPKIDVRLLVGMCIGGCIWGGILLYHIQEYLQVAKYATSTYAGQNAILGVNPLMHIVSHKITFIVYASVLMFLIILKINKKISSFHEIVTYTGVLLLITAIVQMKGYDYHIRVGASFALVSLYVAVVIMVKHKNKIMSLGGRVGVYSVILFIFLWQGIQFYKLKASTITPFDDVVVINNAKKVLGRNTDCKTVYKLSTFAQPLYPAIIDYNIKDVTGFNSFWFLGSFYNNTPSPDKKVIYHKPETMNELEKFFFYKVINDLIRHNPDLIIISDPGVNYFFSVPGFDIYKYYEQDDRFVKFIKGYDMLNRNDGFMWYKKHSLSYK